MLRRPLLAVATTAIALLVSLTGASLAAQSGFAPRITFVNQSALPRHEWGLATVPFPRGVWRGGDVFRVAGVPSELVPFGARWPDGSVRYAQAAARVDLAPGEERSWRVERGEPSRPPFRWSPWVASRLPLFDIELAVGLAGGGQRRVGLRPVALIENSHARKTVHCRDRIPDTDLVYDLWLTFFHDQDQARFELRLTSADTSSTKWEQPVSYVVLEPRACVPVIRGAVRQKLVQSPPDPAGRNPVVLLGPTSFFHGQAYEWYGELLFFDDTVRVPDATRRVQTMLASLTETLWGCADNWAEAKGYGPFGHVPKPPSWLAHDGGRAALIRSHQEFVQYLNGDGEEWEDRPKALYPAASTTGSQHDFGVGKFVGTVSTGLPFGIEEARYVAGEEAHRPVHHREADGSLVRSARHPDWVSLHGRTHWSSTVSPDRLGKPYPMMTPFGHSHGWSGKDDEHWSSLVLAAAYMLTRSHSLAMELDNEAELYLSSHTVPSQKGDWPSNRIGNGRATGRTLLTMSWIHLLTGRADLAQRMRDRVVECVTPQHIGLIEGGVVRPLKITGPDARAVSSGPWWSPWEESQAALGLEACALVTGSRAAHDLAYVITRNLVMHGWRVDFDNSLIGYGMRYLDGGRPLPRSWLNDPEHVAWPRSRAFMVWALPSTRLAMHYALIYGDGELGSRADVIHDATLRLRQPPRSGPAMWDNFAGWDCVPRPQ